MATRLHVAGTTAADISPAFAAEWENVGNAVRRAMSVAGFNQSLASGSFTDSTATANRDVLYVQFVSDAIAPGPIAGTLKGQVWANEFATNQDLRIQMIVRVVSDDGSTFRGTLYGPDTAGLSSEFATSATNRKAPRGGAVPVSSVTAQLNDRIVIELGLRKHAALSTQGGIAWGGLTADPDLPEDETTATFSFRSWFEFSDDLYTPRAQDASATVSLGSLTMTGLATVAIRASAGASLALGSETLTGISLSASAQALATLALGSVSLDGIAAIARVDADAAIGLGEVTLTGIAFDALSSITALLNTATELVIEGTDLTAQVTDESGDYSVLVNRATITNTGTALAITKGDAAIMAAAILNLAGVEAIVRKSEQAQISEGAVTLTGTSLTATETEVGIMTRGVLTITGVEMLASAAVLAAMGHGTLTLTGTAAQGRLGFKFSQFSII